MKNNTIVVFCTCPDKAAARKLATGIVDGGLAACVNIVPGVTSVYRWEGRVQEDSECLLVIKSVDKRLEDLSGYVRSHHPYELPEVVAVPVTGGLQAYLDWVAGESMPGN